MLFGKKVFIIAEAGVNHNGSLELAKKMIDVAKEAGANAVKFQTFNAEKVISKNAPKAEYQKKLGPSKETQLEMAKKFELNEREHEILTNYCKAKGVIFLSTPFDMESVDLLDRLGLTTFKIPSGEITNLPFLRKIGKMKKKVILSTGMSDLGEIEDAIDVLLESGTKKDRLCILHCNTEYPTPLKDVNLRAMLTIRNAFGVDVGYSDHTVGIDIPVAAVALGASVIEKHFTLDKKMEGPDHKASLEPCELKKMICSIRNVEKALGSPLKKASPSESKNKEVVRKSIVAKKDIKKGEVFAEGNITIKRPGSGITPMMWDYVIGKKAPRTFKDDELIEL